MLEDGISLVGFIFIARGEGFGRGGREMKNLQHHDCEETFQRRHKPINLSGSTCSTLCRRLERICDSSRDTDECQASQTDFRTPCEIFEQADLGFDLHRSRARGEEFPE